MLVTWEENDIYGRVVGKKDISERWMISFLSYESGERRFSLTSMIDGLITKPLTKERLAASMNKSGYLPEELL